VGIAGLWIDGLEATSKTWPSELTLAASASSAFEPRALVLTKTIALPGVKGRLDHLALDAKGNRLFVSALGNDTLEVVDIAAGKPLASIRGLHGPAGVLHLTERNQIAVASAGALELFDGASYERLASVGSLDDIDNLRFDPETKRIYAGYAAGALAIIDAMTMQKLGSIALAAHPEAFQLEPHGGRIFVNVTRAMQIAVVDRLKQEVIATWRMEKCRAQFPMALDESDQRLFVGCREPARLVVFDITLGKPVSDLEICGDADDVFYDASRKRLYISCGEGFIDVIDRRDANTYELRERIPTRVGARTSLFSAERDELFLAVPTRGKAEAEIRIFQPEG
jgi:hypothetical protein